MTSAAFQQSLYLPTWNQHKISPTYLSTNLMTPLQIPFRDTVPRSHIIAEGTCRRFRREEWGTFISDYGGLGNLPHLGKTRHQLYSELLIPRSHRHFLSSCGKMVHEVVQPSKITSLLMSKSRQHDEFIVQPCCCKEIDMMKEENHFIKEPCYSSHASRNEMFPKSRAEHEAPLLDHDFRQKTPLSDITRQGLEGVVRRRYKTSSYTNDYQTPHLTGEKNARCHMLKSKKQTQREKANNFNQYPKTKVDHEVAGIWPCWPAGNNYIVCNVTGQIVEKRDVISLDDQRDYRTFKVPQQCPADTKKTEEQPKTNFRSYGDSDFVPVASVEMYGVGPGRVGGGNTDREIPTGIYQHSGSLRSHTGQSYIAKDSTDHYPASSSLNQPLVVPQHSSNSESTDFYKHQNHLKRLDSWKNDTDSDKSMSLRWVKNTKMCRLVEQTVSEDNECEGKEGKSFVSASSSEVTDLHVECLEEEDKEELKNEEYHVHFADSNTSVQMQELPCKKKTCLVNPPYFSTATVKHDMGKISKKDAIVSLELHRNMETISNMLTSLPEKENTKSPPKNCSTVLLSKLLDPTKDPTSVFYKPPLKLPPDPLWKTLQYNGNNIPHRLGVRFKTVATKRYHASHPEPIPDLRDFRPPLRRSKFLGFHTSVFR